MIDVLMRGLESVFAWLLEASWQASVLVALVLLLQWTLRGRLNPRWHHALWLLVIARLLLPALPESALSLFQFAPPPPPLVTETITEPIFAAMPTQLPVTTIPPAEPPLSPIHSISAFTILALIWLTGALGLLLLTWQVNRRFARHIGTAPAVVNPSLLSLADNARHELGTRRRLRMIESAQVQSPAIMGLFCPTLILPKEVQGRFTDEELRFIFLHEFAHLKRGDLFLQWLIALLQIVHWFNPVLWYAFRRMRIDREPATDALVLSRTGEAQKESYGQVLVKLLEHYHTRHSLPTLVGILEDKDQFKRRFTLIARFTRGAYGWSLLGVVVIGVLSVLCLTKQNSRASEPDRLTGHAIGHVVDEQGHSIPGAKVETICYIHGDTTLFGAQPVTSANAEGIFLMEPEKGYEAVGVRVSALGFARKIFHLSYSEQIQNLVLGHGVTVTGSLTKNGQPLPNIQIGIAQTNRVSATFLEEIVATTNPQGQFVLHDVAPHDAYEIHAKRDSLGKLGVTGELHIKTGDPDSTLAAGNLAVEPGVVVSGQIELSDGKSPAMPNDQPVQLHIYRHHGVNGSEGAFDYQYINLGPELKFSFLARTNEDLELSAWITGYHIPRPDMMQPFHVTEHPAPIRIVYQPDAPDKTAPHAGATTTNPTGNIYLRFDKLHGKFFGPLSQYQTDGSHTPGTDFLLSAVVQSSTATEATLRFSQSLPAGLQPLKEGKPFKLDPSQSNAWATVPLGQIHHFRIFNSIDVTTSPTPDPEGKGDDKPVSTQQDLESPLTVAIYGHDESHARALIEKGAPVTFTAMEAALEIGTPAIVKTLWERDPNFCSVMTYAVSQGATIPELEDMRAHGIPVERDYENTITPLGMAARLGNLPVAQWLVDHGAYLTGQGGRDPMYVAMYGNSPEIVDFLVRKGVPVDAGTVEGMESLVDFTQPGVEENHLAMIQVLVKAGALAKATEQQRGDILYQACRVKSAPLVKYFLSLGFNPSNKTMSGQTALDLIKSDYAGRATNPATDGLQPLIDLLEAAAKTASPKPDPAPAATSAESVDADARTVSNFKVTDLPLPDLARKLTDMTTDAANPGVSIEVHIPPGEAPLTMTYGYPQYSGDLNNLLYHLRLLYPIRYEFRDEADRAHWASPAPVVITQLSAAEIQLNKKAAQTKVAFDFHKTDIVTALKSIQSQAAAKGFAFDLDLDAFKSYPLPVVSEEAQDWSVQHALVSLCYLSGLVPTQLDKFTGYRVAPGSPEQLNKNVGIRFGIATAVYKADDATASANLESALSPGKNIAKRTWGPSIVSPAYAWTYRGKQMGPLPGDISGSCFYQHTTGMQAGEVEPVPAAPFVDVHFLNTPLDPTRTRIKSDVTVFIKKPDGTILRKLHGQFVADSGAVIRLVPQGAPLLFDTPGDPKTKSTLNVLVQAGYVATDGWESDLGPTDLDLVTPANTLQDVQLADVDAAPASSDNATSPSAVTRATPVSVPAPAKTDALWASLDADARQVLAAQLKDLPDDQYLATRHALGLDHWDGDDTISSLDGYSGTVATPDTLTEDIAKEQQDVTNLLNDGFTPDHPRIISMKAEIAAKQKQLHEMIGKLKIKDLADAQQRQASAGPASGAEAPRVTSEWLLGARQDADARRVLAGRLATMSDDQFVETMKGLDRADPAITDLDQKIAQVQIDTTNLLNDGYIESHPRIKAMRAEIASLQSRRATLVAGARRGMDIDLQLADSRVALLQQTGAAAPDPVDLKQKLADDVKDLYARRALHQRLISLPDDQLVATLHDLKRPDLAGLNQKIADENVDVAKLLASGSTANSPRIVSERAEIATLGQQRTRLIDGLRAALDVDLAMAESRVKLLKKQLNAAAPDAAPAPPAAAPPPIPMAAPGALDLPSRPPVTP